MNVRVGDAVRSVTFYALWILSCAVLGVTLLEFRLTVSVLIPLSLWTSYSSFREFYRILLSWDR